MPSDENISHNCQVGKKKSVHYQLFITVSNICQYLHAYYHKRLRQMPSGENISHDCVR